MKKHTFKTLLAILCGVFIGAGLFFLYTLRFYTYLGDDPATCVNYHIMAPFYATWMHSSHGRDATCNDCHVSREVNRILAGGLDRALQARLAISKVLAKHGYTDAVPMPDISTKEKAQKFIGSRQQKRTTEYNYVAAPLGI